MYGPTSPGLISDFSDSACPAAVLLEFFPQKGLSHDVL